MQKYVAHIRAPLFDIEVAVCRADHLDIRFQSTNEDLLFRDRLAT